MTFEIEILSNGFAIKNSDILIKITKIDNDRWNYDFYKQKKYGDDINYEAACAPFEANGFPWQTARYKDTLLVNSLTKVLLADKPETVEYVYNLTKAIYDVHEEYLDIQKKADALKKSIVAETIPEIDKNAKYEPLKDPTKICVIKPNDISIITKTFKCNVCGAPILTGKKCFDKMCIGKAIATIPNIPMKEYWLLAEAPIKTTFKDTYNNIMEYTKDHFVFRQSIDYHLYVCSIIASYFTEFFDNVPYSLFMGVSGSGKSLTQKFMTKVSYHGVIVSDMPVSPLFRLIESYKCTIGIDDAELKFDKTESGNALLSIFNSGYERGNPAFRNAKDGEEFIPTPYDTFGFKTLSTTKGFRHTLMSRCIVYIMLKAKPKYDEPDKNKMINLCGELLYLMSLPLEMYKGVIPADARIRQIMRPIYHIAHNANPDIIPELDKYVKELETNATNNEAELFEAQIIQAIHPFFTISINKIFLKTISEYLLNVDNNGYSDNIKIDIDKKELKKMSIRLGFELKKMGFKTYNSKGNLKCLDINDETNKETLELYFKRFGLITDKIIPQKPETKKVNNVDIPQF